MVAGHYAGQPGIDSRGRRTEMPNGPEQRAWLYSESQRIIGLVRQELAEVRGDVSADDFQSVVSSAAKEGMELHSWHIAPSGRIIALFYPATDEALERQRKRST